MTAAFTGLSAPQVTLVADTASSELFFIGGAGSGKTLGGAFAAVTRSLMNPAGVDGLIVAPTFPMLTAPVLPMVFWVLAQLGVRYEHNKSERSITIGGNRKIWMRSAEHPERIAGLNVAWAWIDEAALTDHETYERVQQRMRVASALPVCRQLICTTTPEGRRTWVYERESEAAPGTRVIRATTFDNPGNPADYLERMRRTYANDPAGYAQYISGIATDAKGTIYTNLAPRHFKPAAPASIASGQLVVGWDFNVGTMVTTLATWNEQASTLHVFGEVVTKGDAQTEAHAQRVVDVLREVAGAGIAHDQGRARVVDAYTRPVLAYIDAASGQRSTNAARTDRQLVHQAGFSIRSSDANPLVRDRIASVQYALAHDRLFIDERAAPETARALREHDRDEWGEPRKDASAKFQPDHYADALGYLVHGLLPIGSNKHRPRPVAPAPLPFGHLAR